MGTVTLGDRIVVELSDDVELRQQSSGRRSRGRATAAMSELDAALEDSGFDISADFELVPVPLRRSRAEEVDPAVRVPVAPDEEAVLLVESEGGVFTWVRGSDAAEPGVRRRSGEARVIRFDLAAAAGGAPAGEPGAAPRRRGIVGWIGKRLVDPIRVRVLKFVARAAIDVAVDWVEGDRPFGLVSLAGEPESWIPGAYSGLPAANRPLRVLLMVHGTFSTTAGSFSALAGTDEGRKFLDEARGAYDVILGFDHPTLAADPEENARALAAALEDLPLESHIDAVAYSRGGLVYRTFAERLCPEFRPDLRFGRAVFVGCTNGGTNLANPENWQEMIDLYTNIVMAGARVLTFAGGVGVGALVRTSISTLGRLVQAFPDVAIRDRRVPGLAAMEPDGDFVRELNAAEGRDGEPTDYFVVASDFEPRIEPSKGLTGELAQYLIDRVADRLFGEENDLVVHTRSMSEFGRKASRLGADGMVVIPAAEVVYHTIYFASERLAESLRKWLTGSAREALERGSGAAPPPPPGDLRRRSAEGSSRFGSSRGSGTRSATAGGAVGGGAGRGSFGGVEIGAGAGVSVTFANRGAFDDSGGLEGFPPRRGSTRGLPRTSDGAESGPTSPPETGTAAVPTSCHFAAEMNPTPLVGLPATLFVTISPHGITVAEGPASAATAKPIPLDSSMKIQVEVIPARNCRVLLSDEDEDRQGSACREIDVPTRSSECLRFLLESDTPGPAEVFVEARQGARLLASFLLKPTFIASREDRMSVSQVARPTAALEDEPAVLRIYEMHQATGLRLRFELSCDNPNIGVLENVDLRPGFDLSAFVGDFLAQLENAYNLSGNNYRSFLRRISEFAIVSANDLIPRKIREKLWEHRAAIKAIQVISEDPLIPWELMYVADPEGGTERRGFLSEWGVIRWLYNARWPQRELRLREDGVFYVIPEYLNPGDRLPGAAAERRMLVRRFPGAQEVEARSDSVRTFLQERAKECDILHFACHGEAQQRAILSSDLLMEGIEGRDGKIVDDLVSMDLVSTNADFGEEPPSGLVFINACQTGRPGEGIAGVAGFANSFIRPMTERGTAAFIGALWSVADDLALSFADTVYRNLLDGQTLVEAVKLARKAADANSDFTWLAYTVYGNPFARLVRT